jgi:hypothetical protein
VAAAQRPVCGDECLERLLACHALKTPGAQDFVRSLVTKYLAARRLPVVGRQHPGHPRPGGGGLGLSSSVLLVVSYVDKGVPVVIITIFALRLFGGLWLRSAAGPLPVSKLTRLLMRTQEMQYGLCAALALRGHAFMASQR